MMRLFLFPYAGASKYSYNSILPLFDSGIDAFVLELPGRGRRIKEPLLTDISLMVEDLFSQIKHHINIRYCFFGHSMGTILAYLVAVRISQIQGMKQPEYLFLSGRQAPSIPSKMRSKHDLPIQELIKDLKTMGGMQEEGLMNEELIEFVAPILRADFEAIEKYQYVSNELLQVSLVVTGTNEDISHEEASAWQEVTIRKVEVIQFDGDHFFIFKPPFQITQLINTKLGDRSDTSLYHMNE